MASYEVPNVMEYVLQTAQTYELEHAVKEWNRKIEIAEQENQMLKKQFSRL